MAQKYSLGNSLSPMMFRKGKNKESKEPKERKERSRSLDDILSADFGEKVKRKPAKGKSEEGVWEEVDSVSTVAPVVMCILPPLSADFVSSALLAVGATPLLTDGTKGEGGEVSAAIRQGHVHVCICIVEPATPSCAQSIVQHVWLLCLVVHCI